MIPVWVEEIIFSLLNSCHLELIYLSRILSVRKIRLNLMKAAHYYSLYFPLFSSIAITIHLVKEILRLINAHKTEKLDQSCWPDYIRGLLQLLILSSCVTFCICTAVTSGLSFCNYYEGDTLKCLISHYQLESDFSGT